ncbi:Protein SEY1 [Choanephora cucurbitarum]|uniref:Protein SEY1 n=1 Tax=Choanephora cucurbitarum TaxID=101091 RepID=A0A1C7N1V7_9FUNG|nr:Protein SEY1 [Choanephora cucurbitarum]
MNSDASATKPTENGNNNTQPNSQIQVINEEKKFNQNLAKHFQEWGLLDVGLNYNVVAVFGSQSTGKSTLLNRLFGTDFVEMKENSRKQTTKGIWLSRARDMRVLVMDVEGTDGRERGEDQDFERKSALFSMATSEVIIINLWEHQVGLYQGANMGLLKTVFEVNLQLFQNQKKETRIKEKTLLFIVIRDLVGTTPLDNLASVLRSDFEKNWESLSKPEDLKDCKITDYFDFMFIGLPHKILQPDQFNNEVINLRKRFNDPSNPDYVFRPEYHKRIPADGYELYASSIWDKILTNKDLDLPTQQELLAQYRCDEIANNAFDIFREQLAPLKSPVLEKNQILPDLGEKMTALREQALQMFDKSSSRYNQTVYQKKRLDMLNKLNSQLSIYFTGQLGSLRKKAVQTFDTELDQKLKAIDYNFTQIVHGCTEHAKNIFLNGAKAILLSDTDWSFHSEEERMKEDLEAISSRARTEEYKKMHKVIEKQIESDLSDSISIELNRPDNHMWHKIIQVYKSITTHAESMLSHKAKSFDSSPEDLKQSLEEMKIRAWLLLRKKVDEELTDNLLLLKLRNQFEDKFRYDDKGVPKVWKPEDDIDIYFRKARDETLDVIKLYAQVDLSQDKDFNIDATDDFDFSQSLRVLSEAKQIDIANRFKRESDAFYLEAKRSVVSTTAKVPTWVIGLMIFLGWNEFMAIVKNPLYLVIFSFCIMIGYVLYALNLWGPAERIFNTVVNEGTRMVKRQLVEVVNTTEHQPQYEMTTLKDKKE